jgi:hypothetical protein
MVLVAVDGDIVVLVVVLAMAVVAVDGAIVLVAIETVIVVLVVVLAMALVSVD